MSARFNDENSMTAKIKTYDVEIENGILNMVVSLCQQKANDIGMDEAKKQVSNWLERIIVGLRKEEDNTQIFGEQ